MNLQHIDIRAESLHARINRIEDMLPRETSAIDEFTVVCRRRRNGWKFALVINAEVAFGQNDHAVARDVELLQGLADDFLGPTVGVDVRLINRKKVNGLSLHHASSNPTVSQVLMPCL